MASVPPKRIAAPNFRTARLVGIFNVVFASQILICGLCMGSWVASMPVLSRGMQQVQSEMQAQVDRTRKSQLKALEEQEKAAKTPEEKAEAAVRRKDLEAQPKAMIPGMMDYSKLGLNDPASVAWSWTEVLSGIVLNVMMLVSGVGLLSWRPWAWKLALWTAILKVARLVVLYAYFVLALVPPLAKNLGDMVGEMMVQQQAMLGRAAATPPTEFFVRTYAVMYSLMGLGMIALGVVYPALVVWFLTRPGVRSACSGVFLPPKEPNQPC